MRSAEMPLPTKPHDGSGDMRNGREVEIKLKTDAAGLKLAMASQLLACLAPEAPRRTLRSIYFDTASGDLRKDRIALRVRETGHRSRRSELESGGPNIQKSFLAWRSRSPNTGHATRHLAVQLAHRR